MDLSAAKLSRVGERASVKERNCFPRAGGNVAMPDGRGIGR
jgi:hypothetical protein